MRAEPLPGFILTAQEIELLFFVVSYFFFLFFAPLFLSFTLLPLSFAPLFFTLLLFFILFIELFSLASFFLFALGIFFFTPLVLRALLTFPSLRLVVFCIFTAEIVIWGGGEE